MHLLALKEIFLVQLADSSHNNKISHKIKQLFLIITYLEYPHSHLNNHHNNRHNNHLNNNFKEPILTIKPIIQQQESIINNNKEYLEDYNH